MFLIVCVGVLPVFSLYCLCECFTSVFYIVCVSVLAVYFILFV